MDKYLAENFFNELKQIGFNLVVGVPCSLLGSIISYAEQDRNLKYICASNEGEAVAIAVGAYLAGKRAVVFCQNSGLGNMVNSLSSLVHPFQVPLLIITSWRGKPGTEDEPQHMLMGSITLKTLKMLKVKTLNFPTEQSSIKSAIKLIDSNFLKGISTCLIVDKKLKCQEKTSQEKYIIKKRNPKIIRSYLNSPPTLLTRWKALENIVNFFPKDTAFLSTTGKTGRELFTLNDTNRNFYMVGSMGHVSAIGLGISLYTSKKVVILDGDGSLLMKMGNMATIGHYAPQTFYHVLLNNNVYDSTGGQANTSDTINFLQIARGCNYSAILDVDTNNFKTSLEKLSHHKGPYFIQIKISPGSLEPLGRPTLMPQEVSKRFSTFLQQDDNLSPLAGDLN